MGSSSQLWSCARRAKLIITMEPLYLTRGARRQVPASSATPGLFEDVDILFGADVLEDLGPHADGNFAEMRFPQQEHERAGLADAAADAQRNFILQNGLVIGELLRQVGVLSVFELGKELLDVEFGFDEHFPDFADDLLQEIEVALLGGDGALPIPLVHVDAMVVVEEIVLADGAHVRAKAFARTHAEFLE